MKLKNGKFKILNIRRRSSKIMAQFDESKVINALHTDKVEVGKKYWYSDELTNLKEYVENNEVEMMGSLCNVEIGYECKVEYPFYITGSGCYQFLYPYEEPSKQRMTNIQFCEWLAKGNGQWQWKDSSQYHVDYSYSKTFENKEVDEDIIIRSWDSDEWVSPTVDIYERDCKKEN